VRRFPAPNQNHETNLEPYFYPLNPSKMKYKIGSKEQPMLLKTPPLSSEYTMHVEEKNGEEILVCTVGKTVLHYRLSCIEDLHQMLKQHGDWMELGSADEQKPAKDGTVEAWGRSEQNPVGGWYGLKKGFRGRFGMYIPPLMEALGLAELTHNAKGNQMRAL
jgi:hypothetical protein